jgi:hypothetical protein
MDHILGVHEHVTVRVSECKELFVLHNFHILGRVGIGSYQDCIVLERIRWSSWEELSVVSLCLAHLGESGIDLLTHHFSL